MAAGRNRMRSSPMHLSRCSRCSEPVAVLSMPGGERLLVDLRDVRGDLYVDTGERIAVERLVGPAAVRVVHRCAGPGVA